jgi:hypothetical protein
MQKSIFLIPSFYGLVGWMFAILCTFLTPLPINELTLNTIVVILYVVIVHVVSIYLNISITGEAKNSFGNWLFGNHDTLMTYFCLLFGIYGLYLYYNLISEYVGGLSGVVYIIQSGDFLSIRAMAENFETIGIQLSYFSWAAIFFNTTLLVRDMRVKNKIVISIFRICIILLLIGGNMIFIDRTRPTMIIISMAFGVISLWKFSDFNFFRFFAVFPAVIVGIFVGFLLLTGKYDNSVGLLGSFFIYGASGIGFLNDVLSTDSGGELTLMRTFYWLAKLLEIVGVVGNVPSQAVEFRMVPFPTNVGTFLEPLISDGGIWYAMLLCPIIVFFVDRVSLIALRSHTATGVFLWTNGISTAALSFFVPKFNLIHYWLFIFMFVAVAVVGKSKIHRQTRGARL